MGLKAHAGNLDDPFGERTAEASAPKNQPRHEVAGRERAEEALRQLNASLERRNRDLSALHEVGRTLMGTLDVREIYRVMYREVGQKILDSPHFLVAKLAEDGQAICCDFGVVDGQEIDPTSFPPMTLGDGPISETFQTRQPKIVDFQPVLREWEKRKRVVLIGDERRPKSAMYIPMICADRFVGVISVQHYEADAYDDAELSLVTTLASQAAMALENARLLEAERAAREQTEALREAGRVIGASLEVSETLRLVLDQLRRVLVYDSASVLVLREGNVADLLVGRGYEDERLVSREAGRLLQQSPILQRMADDRQPVVSADVRELEGWIWVPGAEQVRSWMGIPLVAHGRMIGALSVDHSQPGFFGKRELRLAQVLAQHAAQALENARLYEERVHAEREAQERRVYLEAVLAAAPDAIVTLNAHHWLVEWNAGAEALFGYLRQEVLGRDIDDLITGPDTVEEAAAITQCVLGGKAAGPIETIRRRKDGSAVDVLLAAAPILVDGELIGCMGVYKDISERKRAERALRKANRGLHMLSRCNEVLSRAREEAQLLRQVCQIATGIGGYRLAWVGFAEQDDAKSVRPVAQAGLEEGYLEMVSVTWADTERGRGPTGTAIRTGKPAIARDILADPSYAPWREEALRRGYASSIALPLRTNGKAFGALNIYAPEPDAFDPQEVGLLTELADNLAYGIVALQTRAERARVEEALRRYAERLETLRQIDQAIVEAQSPEAIAQAALARMGRLVPFQKARITAFDAEPKGPELLAAYVEETAGMASESAGGQDDRAAAHETLRTEVSIPLLARGELIGTLHLEAGIGEAFTQEQVEIAYEVADPLAVAIEHARLHEQLQVYAGSLEETVAQRTRELKAERDRTQAILESLGEAVVVTDVEGTILYTNPASTALTGYSSEESLGQDWRALQGDGGVSKVFGRAQEAMLARETWRGELANRRKDDTSYDAAVTVTPLFAPDDANQLVGSVWVQRNITPLKQAERFKDQFVSNVSHELRTPLSIVTLVAGNLDRLYDRLDDDKRREMIRSVREQVGLLNDLIDDVLEISRIDSEGISVERSRVNLVDLVRAEMEKQGPLARRKSLALHLAGTDTLVVQGNESQLRQVIRNLLNNAIKFTPNGGQVTCDCLVQEGGSTLDMEWPGGKGLPPGRWAALRVADTGIGIDAAYIPRLFERFYRVKTEWNVPGTGLGLAITRELVELHGGHVAVASAQGEGSVFAFYLPLAEEE